MSEFTKSRPGEDGIYLVVSWPATRNVGTSGVCSVPADVGKAKRLTGKNITIIHPLALRNIGGQISFKQQ